jgi:hypothetical protein
MGFGEGAIDHCVPFHASTIVLEPLPPTAVQNVDVRHDTPVRAALFSRGVDAVFHAEPFQLSTSGDSVELVSENPTAVHAFAAMQLTPDSWLSNAPDGLGVVCKLHVVPFQRSAMVTSVCDEFS